VLLIVRCLFGLAFFLFLLPSIHGGGGSCEGDLVSYALVKLNTIRRRPDR
jgi:hypothetical protein